MTNTWSWIIHSVGFGALLTVVACASLIAREVRFARTGRIALSDASAIVSLLAVSAIVALVVARFIIIA